MARYQRNLPIVCVLLIICACTPEQKTDSIPIQSLPLTVEYSGCQSVSAGPVCVLGKENRVNVWVWTSLGATLEFAGYLRMIGQAVSVLGGKRFQFEIRPGTKTLKLKVFMGSAERHWQLLFAYQSRPSWYEQAEKSRISGNTEEAHRVLRATKESAGAHIGTWYTALARLAFYENKLSEAEEYYKKALVHHANQGRLSDYLRDGVALSFVYVFHGRRFEQANRVLKSVKSIPGFAISTINLGLQRSFLAASVGDLRTAVQQSVQAIQCAKRHGLVGLQRSAENDLALQWLKIGMVQKAIQLLDQLLQNSAAPKDQNEACWRARLLANAVWARVLSFEAGEEFSTVPFEMIAEGLAILHKGRCSRSETDRLNFENSFAITLFHQGDLKGAQQKIDSIRKNFPKREIVYQISNKELEARIALKQGQHKKAKKIYLQLVDLCRSILSPEGEWRAIVGLAQTLQSMGKFEEALLKYDKAQALSRKSVLQVAIAEGRAAFMVQRSQAVQNHLLLLIQLRREAQALDVVRRHIAQELRGIQRADRLAALSDEKKAKWDQLMTAYQQDREQQERQVANAWELTGDQWRLARQNFDQDRRKLIQLLDQAFALISAEQDAEKLARPNKDELYLLFFPIQQGWLGFAADSRGVQAKRLESQSLLQRSKTVEAQLAKQLLGMFSNKIRDNTLISIMPTQKLQFVDFHALPFSNDVLLASNYVRYRLDLSQIQPKPTTKPEGKRRALLVIDPELNLPKARSEVVQIEKTLARKGDWTVVKLAGDQATRLAVLQELQRADWFHYAGHAEFGDQLGWNSSLRLAHGTRIEIADLLFLDKAPKTVVLLACDSGKSDVTKGSNIGLAQAFIAAGSQAVIASTRTLSDTATQRFSSLFYQRWATRGVELQQALHHAQLSQKKSYPTDDWASLRLFVP